MIAPAPFDFAHGSDAVMVSYLKFCSQMNALSTHPILGSVLIFAALSHAACIVLMLRLKKVSYGYEDENGSYFISSTSHSVVALKERAG
jgi:hypothetical protein